MNGELVQLCRYAGSYGMYEKVKVLGVFVVCSVLDVGGMKFDRSSQKKNTCSELLRDASHFSLAR